MKHPQPALIDSPQAFQAKFGVSRETVEKLSIYADLLNRWQKTINLVAPSTLNQIWHRHFADSAQLFKGSASVAVSNSHWLDVGSGAGFPGLVLAILGAEKPQTRHTLIESDTRKAAFLRQVARETGVAVEIVSARIELPQNTAKVRDVDFVTARALAPLPRLLPLVAPYFRVTTIGLFLKGREVGDELLEAGRDWEFESQLLPSITSADGRIVRLTGLHKKIA